MTRTVDPFTKKWPCVGLNSIMMGSEDPSSDRVMGVSYTGDIFVRILSSVDWPRVGTFTNWAYL